MCGHLDVGVVPTATYPRALCRAGPRRPAEAPGGLRQPRRRRLQQASRTCAIWPASGLRCWCRQTRPESRPAGGCLRGGAGLRPFLAAAGPGRLYEGRCRWAGCGSHLTEEQITRSPVSFRAGSRPSPKRQAEGCPLAYDFWASDRRSLVDGIRWTMHWTRSVSPVDGTTLEDAARHAVVAPPPGRVPGRDCRCGASPPSCAAPMSLLAQGPAV